MDWRRPERDSLSSLLERADLALAEGNLEAGRALIQNALARIIVRGKRL
jgi:hypothetical protein